MAATGTPTPNIGLRIPIGTDPASVDDINYNSNLLDTKLGAVGSDSVQDQIDTLNGKFGQIFYCEHINCTPSAGITAGEAGYFTVPVTYAKGKNIISTSIGLGHPGVAGGYSLTGMYANTQNAMYVSYYSPKSITASNADFSVDIVYTDVAMGWNSYNETV